MNKDELNKLRESAAKGGLHIGVMRDGDVVFPAQVKHRPQLQADLDKLAAQLGVGTPDPDQSLKHPRCGYEREVLLV